MFKQSVLIAALLAFCCFVFPPDVVHGAYTFPARLTFTFDDSVNRIYTNAAPVLATYNFPGVDYAEIALMNSGEDWVMTWDQLKGLRDSYGWEIGSHTINHPYLTQVSDAQLKEELAGSQQAFADHGIQTTTFATPYGDYDTRVLKAISRYYLAHRAAWGGANVWPAAYNDYELVVYEVKNKTTPETVNGWISKAVQNKQWLILLFHDIVTGTPKQYEYNVNNLKKVVDFAAQQPIKVLTLAQGLQLTSAPNLVANYSFENPDANGFASNWTRNNASAVTVDTNQNGNAPLPQNSLKIIGGSGQNEAQSEYIPVNPGTSYILKMLQDASGYVSGSWLAAVQEYDAQNNLLGTQKLGTYTTAYFGVRYYIYTPSTQTTQIKLLMASLPGANLTLYFDSVDFRSVDPGGTPPPVTPTPLPTPVPTPHVTPIPSPIPTVTPIPTPHTTPMPSPIPTATPVATPHVTPTISPTPVPTPIPTLHATPTPTPKPTATPVSTPTPTAPLPTGVNLLANGSFENLDTGGFSTSWTRNNNTAITVDTLGNGFSPNPKNSLKIIAGPTQYTTISAITILPDSSASYNLSVYEKITNYQKGGTAVWIDEFNTNNKWLSGKWLGGRYAVTNQQLLYTYKPTSVNVKNIQVHLFTEANSSLTVYFDEVNLIKK